MKKDRRALEARPSLSSELIDLPPIRASAKMPKALAELVSPYAQPRPAELRPVERTKGTAVTALDAHRPAWWDASMRPTPSKFPRPRRLLHAGREIEPMWIWPPDDRRLYNDPSHYPWLCVCRVATGKGVSSGVLIGPRHVLTASHAMDWRNPVVRVEVHRHGTFELAESRATDIFSYTKIEGEIEHDTVDEDYVVVALEKRLGDAFGWMGCRTYDSRWDGDPYWFNIGYPRELGASVIPSWQREKNLDEDEFDYGGGRVMTTSADIMKGNSGGPMFGFWNDGMPYVVAVVSGEGDGLFTGRENYCAGGGDLTRLVHHARKTLP